MFGMPTAQTHQYQAHHIQVFARTCTCHADALSRSFNVLAAFAACSQDVDPVRHPKMQKLLKAMPDVRRDYVRELDTALVESRIFPLKDVWSSIVSSRIVFQHVSTCFNLVIAERSHWSTLFDPNACITWAPAKEVPAILMTSRCCESRSKVPSRRGSKRHRLNHEAIILPWYLLHTISYHLTPSHTISYHLIPCFT